MRSQIINIENSSIAQILVPQTEPLQLGNVFMFHGNILREHRPDGIIYERILVKDINNDNLYAISASQLIHAKGSIRKFIRNYDTLGEALEALYDKTLTVSDIEYETRQFPIGPVTFKILTIDIA